MCQHRDTIMYEIRLVPDFMQLSCGNKNDTARPSFEECTSSPTGKKKQNKTPSTRDKVADLLFYT